MSLYQSFGDSTKCTNYSEYHGHFHVRSLSALQQDRGTHLSFHFLLVLPCDQSERIIIIIIIIIIINLSHKHWLMV